MVTEEKNITRSIRADKEVFQRLADLAKDKGLQQGAALEALLNAWDVQNAKGLVPERAADVADFDAHLQGIQKAFLRSLDLAQSAESRARVSYSAQLDAMSGTIARLEKELAETQSKLKTQNSALHEMEVRAERAEKRVAELEKAQADGSRTEALLTAVQALLKERTAGDTSKAQKAAKGKKSGKTAKPDERAETASDAEAETAGNTVEFPAAKEA